jgi:hypothetical protein
MRGSCSSSSSRSSADEQREPARPR